MMSTRLERVSRRGTLGSARRQIPRLHSPSNAGISLLDLQHSTRT